MTSQDTALLKQGNHEIPLLSYEFNSNRSIVDLELHLPDDMPFPLATGGIHEKIYLILPQAKERFLCLYEISNYPLVDILDLTLIQSRFAVRKVPWIVRLQKAKIENEL